MNKHKQKNIQTKKKNETTHITKNEQTRKRK